MPPNFLSRLVKASPTRERTETYSDLPQPSSVRRRIRSPSTPNPTVSSRPPSPDIPPLPSLTVPSDTPPNVDKASIHTASSSTTLNVTLTVVPPSPLPRKLGLSASSSEQDLRFPPDSREACSDSDMRGDTKSQTLEISPRVRTISAPSRPSSAGEGLMTPKLEREKSPSRSRPSSPSSNFANLKQKLQKSASTLSLSPSSDMRRKSSNKSLKQPPAPIIVPPVPAIPSLSHHSSEGSAEGSAIVTTTPIVASPDKIRSADEFLSHPLSAPVLQSIDTNGSSLQAPKRDPDNVSIASASSQGQGKEKRRQTWRPGSANNSRKPSGLAGAIAASGLAMANPTMTQAHFNASMVQLSQSNSSTVSSRKTTTTTASHSQTSAPPSHSKSRSADLTTSPKPLLPSRRRTTASIYSDTGSEHYLDGSEYLELDADSGLDDDRSESGTDSDLDLGHEIIPVTGFAVASTKRNADFHELFPAVPDGDYLIEDYGCALQREILIQGRLYVSENHVCFHANIFGWITDLCIPVYDITSLEKKMTAFVIPNGIQISTRTSKYTFASFLSRDTTFDVIYNVWRQARPDDSASIFSSARASLEGASSEQDAIVNGIPKAVNRVTQCACSKNGQHYPEVAMDVVLPGTPDRIHNLIFASGFFKDFLAVDQKIIDIQISDWTPIEPGSKLLARNMSYIRPLNGSLGPKQTKCEIRDETIHADPEDYLTMLTTTRTPDVPSGGVFAVKTRTCIMWASAITTKVVVTTQVEWTGRSFIKSIIEKSAIDGQKSYHADLERAMRAYIQEHQSEFVPAGIDPAVIELAESPPRDEDKAGVSEQHRLSEEEERRQREHERNRRGLQWAWDTFDGAYQVAKRSTKGALELVRDAWDQSSTTTILWFVIVILVFSNLWTMLRMGRREEIGRRKELMRAEERDRWMQGVVGVLRDELVVKTQQQPFIGDLPHGGSNPALPSTGSPSWHDEISNLRHALDNVEERIKFLRDSVDEVAKTTANAGPEATLD